MTAQERRAAILEVLSRSHQPVSAGALARRFGVSRQLIVGDVALLRAGGAAIDATARGYVVQGRQAGLIRRAACRHQAARRRRSPCPFSPRGRTCTPCPVPMRSPSSG